MTVMDQIRNEINQNKMSASFPVSYAVNTTMEKMKSSLRNIQTRVQIKILPNTNFDIQTYNWPILSTEPMLVHENNKNNSLHISFDISK